jgi:DNA polymerase
MGRAVTITRMRGTIHTLDDGTRALVTIHPSWLLRMDDDERKDAEYRHFVSDLKIAARSLKQAV